jgi:uncharacterized protein YjbJ (UPF0337 family)
MSDATRDRVEGNVDQAKGTVKEKVGNATGNEQLQDEGVLDQAEGKIKEGMADVKSAVDGVVKKVTGNS